MSNTKEKTDYLSMFSPNEANKDFMFAVDLDGEEYTLEIVKVAAGELTGDKGRKTRKPVVWFKGARKGLALNKTNGKIIRKLYGKFVEDWIGKRITIFPTTTVMDGETKDCIRVRPSVPNTNTASSKTAPDGPPPAPVSTTTPPPPAEMTEDEIAAAKKLELEDGARG